MILIILALTFFSFCDPTNPSCYLKTFYINRENSNDIDYELRCWNPQSSGETTTGMFHYDVAFDESVDQGTDCTDWVVSYDYTNFNLVLIGKDSSKVDYCGVVIYDAGNSGMERKEEEERFLPPPKTDLGCLCNYSVSNSKKHAYILGNNRNGPEKDDDGCYCYMYSPGDLDKIEMMDCDKSSWTVTNSTTAVFLSNTEDVNSSCKIHITWKSYHP